MADFGCCSTNVNLPLGCQAASTDKAKKQLLETKMNKNAFIQNNTILVFENHRQQKSTGK